MKKSSEARPVRLNKTGTTRSEICLRLIRGDDVPASHGFVEDYVFGLQDTKQQIVAGQRQADGTLVFDFCLQVKPT